MSGGKSSSDSASTSTQGVWAPQGDVLSGLYGEAPGVFSQFQSQLPDLQQGMTDWTDQVGGAAMDSWQNQMRGGAYAGYDIAGSLSNSLGGAMGAPTQQQQALYGDTGFQQGAGFDQGDGFVRGDGGNYVDSMQNTMLADANRAQEQMLGGLDARAAASGMSGGSRHGTATAQGMQDINQNLQANMANLGYQDYNNQQNMAFQDYTNQQNMGFQDYTNQQNMGFNDYNAMMQRAQQAGAGADQNILQQQQLMSGLLGGQQSAQANALMGSGDMNLLGSTDYNNAMMPINAYSQMLQSMSGPVVLTDSDSDSSQSSRQGGL